MVFEHPEWDGHEEVVYLHDAASGLRAIVALHRVRGGASLGGIRCFPYPDSAAALTDVLRLSRAMTYKWALTGLGWGGGKTAVLADPRTDKTPQLLRALGRAIGRFDGRYRCAPDVGTDADDMVVLREETEHVAGLPGAETSVATAIGLYHALRAMARHVLGRDGLGGVRIAVQGAGGVGSRLCRHLADAGAEVLVADVDAERVAAVCAATGARAIDAATVLAAEVDLLAPCALGGILDERSIPTVRARGICGAANNQLATEVDAERLRRHAIVWAPDYVVSAGGILSGAHELGRIDADELAARLEAIHDTLLEVLERAEREGVSTEGAARAMATEAVARPSSPP